MGNIILIIERCQRKQKDRGNSSLLDLRCPFSPGHIYQYSWYSVTVCPQLLPWALQFGLKSCQGFSALFSVMADITFLSQYSTVNQSSIKHLLLFIIFLLYICLSVYLFIYLFCLYVSVPHSFLFICLSFFLSTHPSSIASVFLGSLD